MSHDSGIDSGKSDGADGGKRLNALFLCRFLGHKHHGCRGGVQRGRVAGRDHSVRLESRLEVGHTFRGGIFPDCLILVHGHNGTIGLFGINGQDFFFKESFGSRLGGSLMGPGPPFV